VRDVIIGFFLILGPADSRAAAIVGMPRSSMTYSILSHFAPHISRTAKPQTHKRSWKAY